MKETITKYQFRNWFRSSDNYKNNFSYDGLGALFDHIEELENDIGEDIEFDPIALCCEYSEYDSLVDFQEDYSEDYQTIGDIESDTTVIMIDDESFIIEQF
tara:strand:+ start:293 stop:595 length:303 start_codon:yes stop_codon:yes gene_type:complete